MTDKYKVRQYRPAYFTGFDNDVISDVEYDKITEVPFMSNFKHEGFKEFKLSEYGDELIIVAYYGDGKHWVAGFATKEDSMMASDWRYKPHQS